MKRRQGKRERREEKEEEEEEEGEKLRIDGAEASLTSLQRRERCQLLLIVDPTYRTGGHTEVFPRYITSLLHTFPLSGFYLAVSKFDT